MQNPWLYFDPLTLLTTLKKPNAFKIWPISLILACTSIAISMLELVQFPSNEKSLQKIKLHTLLDSWTVNLNYLKQVATLGFIDNRDALAHTTFYNMWFSMHVVFPVSAPNSNHSPPFSQSSLSRPQSYERL